MAGWEEAKDKLRRASDSSRRASEVAVRLYVKHLTLREIGEVLRLPRAGLQIHSQLKRRIRERLESDSLPSAKSPRQGSRRGPRPGKLKTVMPGSTPHERARRAAVASRRTAQPDPDVRRGLLRHDLVAGLGRPGRGGRRLVASHWPTGLMLAGLVLFWLGWWHVDKGRDRAR